MTREKSTSLKYWLEDPFFSKISSLGLSSAASDSVRRGRGSKVGDVVWFATAWLLLVFDDGRMLNCTSCSRETAISVFSSSEMRLATSVMVVFRTRRTGGPVCG